MLTSFFFAIHVSGFKRLTAGRDKGAYYHELFLRSKRFLAGRIERMKVKGTGVRKPNAPESEPNFYLGPFLPPEVPDEEVPQNGAELAPAAQVPPATSSTNLTAAPNLAMQRLFLSSMLSEPSLQFAAPSTVMRNLTSHILATSTGTALMLEAHRAQAATSLLLRQLQDQSLQLKAETLERLLRLRAMSSAASQQPNPNALIHLLAAVSRSRSSEGPSK